MSEIRDGDSEVTEGCETAENTENDGGEASRETLEASENEAEASGGFNDSAESVEDNDDGNADELSEDEEADDDEEAVGFKDNTESAEDTDSNEDNEDNEDIEEAEEKNEKDADDAERDKNGLRKEKIDGVTYYFDDNDNCFRVEDKLVANSEYTINGYRYETDDLGRIKSAEGKLHMKDRDKRLNIRDSMDDVGQGDQEKTDDRGHLIADRFDGSNGLENMVPQNADVNRKEFRNFENELAKYAQDENNDVRVKVIPEYDDDTQRPSRIKVEYSINGVQDTKTFDN